MEQIAVKIGGTPISHNGFQYEIITINDSKFVDLEDKEYGTKELTYFIQIKNSGTVYGFIDFEIAGRDPLRQGRLSLGIFIPKGYRIEGSNTPFELLQDLRAQFYVDNANIEKYGEFPVFNPSLNKSGLEGIVNSSKYKLSRYPLPYRYMNERGDVGLYCARSEDNIRSLMEDPQFDEILGLKKLIVICGEPENSTCKRINLEVPRKIEYTIVDGVKRVKVDNIYRKISVKEDIYGPESIIREPKEINFAIIDLLNGYKPQGVSFGKNQFEIKIDFSEVDSEYRHCSYFIQFSDSKFANENRQRFEIKIGHKLINGKDTTNFTFEVTGHDLLEPLRILFDGIMISEIAPIKDYKSNITYKIDISNLCKNKNCGNNGYTLKIFQKDPNLLQKFMRDNNYQDSEFKAELTDIEGLGYKKVVPLNLSDGTSQIEIESEFANLDFILKIIENDVETFIETPHGESQAINVVFGKNNLVKISRFRKKNFFSKHKKRIKRTVIALCLFILGLCVSEGHHFYINGTNEDNDLFLKRIELLNDSICILKDSLKSQHDNIKSKNIKIKEQSKNEDIQNEKSSYTIDDKVRERLNSRDLKFDEIKTFVNQKQIIRDTKLKNKISNYKNVVDAIENGNYQELDTIKIYLDQKHKILLNSIFEGYDDDNGHHKYSQVEREMVKSIFNKHYQDYKSFVDISIVRPE